MLISGANGANEEQADGIVHGYISETRRKEKTNEYERRAWFDKGNEGMQRLRATRLENMITPFEMESEEHRIAVKKQLFIVDL